MNLVMRVSDKVVALELGRKIADGLPAQVQNEPGGRSAPIWASRCTMPSLLEVQRPARALRRRARAARHRLHRRQGGHHRAARRQRRRQDDHAAGAERHDPHRGQHHARRRAHRRLPPEDIARRGVAHVPDGRGTFLELTRRREPAARRLHAPRRGGGRSWSACSTTSPSCASGCSSRPARCPAASSRCWRSAARCCCARACCCWTSRPSAWRR